MYGWYDSWWLADYADAREILQRDRPELLDRFTAALRVFEAPRDFVTPTVDAVFDEPTLARIRETMKSFDTTELEFHEAKIFGRFVVHDHAYFTELQHALVPLVSRLAGETVEPSYNFASLYGAPGVCPPHLDAPDSKWTLDVCIRQSGPWPINVSRVVPWPNPGDWPVDNDARDQAVKLDPTLQFTPITLEPNQALLFSGCNQWHYRDRAPAHQGRAFCELLFFHFIPAGTRDLIDPAKWASIFGAPELAGLGRRNPKSI